MTRAVAHEQLLDQTALCDTWSRFDGAKQLQHPEFVSSTEPHHTMHTWHYHALSPYHVLARCM